MHRQLGVVLLIIASVQASSVLVFKDSDFKARVQQYDIILVEFYAPWCGHCKKFAPEYEKAASRLLKNDPPIPLAKVDCIAETKICDEFGITGYPKLKVFKGGQFVEDYEGPRDADNVIQSMIKMVGPISKQLKTVQDLEDFKARDGGCVVGFFKKTKSYMAQAFNQTAEEYGDLRFAYTSSPEIFKHTKYKDGNIVLYRPKVMDNLFEPNFVKYDGDASTQNMKLFLDLHRFGMCGHRTSLNADKFRKPLFVAFYDVDYIRNAKGTNYWRNRIMKVAQTILSERMAYFAISNRDEHNQEVEDCGLGSSLGDTPAVCAYDEHHRKFKMEGEWTMESFEKFVRAVLSEEMDPFVKSEAVPETNDEPVKKVVGRNFNELVNNKQKDVLIEFYAPWCTHCQDLAPKYRRVGELFKNEPNLVIAKMDATANDVPTPYEIKGFPDIYFAAKGAKHKPVKYTGPREVKEIVQFVAEEATDDLVGFDRYGNKKESAKKTEL